MSHQKKEWPDNLLARIFGAKHDLEFDPNVEQRLNKALKKMQWGLGRTILELRYKKGKSNEMIANILNLDTAANPKIVGVLEGKAIKILRDPAVRASLIGAPGPISEYLKSAYPDKSKIPLDFIDVSPKVLTKIKKVWIRKHPPAVQYVKTTGDLAYMISTDQIYSVGFLDAGEIADTINALIHLGYTRNELGLE